MPNDTDWLILLKILTRLPKSRRLYAVFFAFYPILLVLLRDILEWIWRERILPTISLWYNMAVGEQDLFARISLLIYWLSPGILTWSHFFLHELCVCVVFIDTYLLLRTWTWISTIGNLKAQKLEELKKCCEINRKSQGLTLLTEICILLISFSCNLKFIRIFLGTQLITSPHVIFQIWGDISHTPQAWTAY